MSTFQTSGSRLQEDELTELDKIFLLLTENNLKDSFNVLCYDLEVRTIADWQKLDEEALKRFRLLPNFAKDQLRTLPQKAEKTDFVALALVSTVCMISSLVFYSELYWNASFYLLIIYMKKFLDCDWLRECSFQVTWCAKKVIECRKE